MNNASQSLQKLLVVVIQLFCIGIDLPTQNTVAFQRLCIHLVYRCADNRGLVIAFRRILVEDVQVVIRALQIRAAYATVCPVRQPILLEIEWLSRVRQFTDINAQCMTSFH